VPGEEWYPINECYWSYVRVYKQAGVELLKATPHAIPEEWTIQYKNVPPQVDSLEEELPGVQGFGTLLVVPGSKTLSTSFEFALPNTVLSASTASGEYTYSLKVQKQPGTLKNPLTIRIHLPRKAVLKSVPPGAILENNHLLLETNLRADVEFEITFTFP
jgi:hypothetical protein